MSTTPDRRTAERRPAAPERTQQASWHQTPEYDEHSGTEDRTDVWQELDAWEPEWIACEPTYSGELGARGVIVGWHVRILHSGWMARLTGDGPTIPEAIAAALKAGGSHEHHT